MNILILLIGGNPLPNYITAKYLLTQGREDKLVLPVPDKIVFVYSGKTEYFAENIIKELIKEDILNKKEQVSRLNLEASERDPETIINRLGKTLGGISSLRSLHLNYTGGTKTMSVFGALTAMVYDWQQANSDAMFLMSDLDPNSHRFVVLTENLMRHATPAFKRLPAKVDLREHVKIDVNILFALHGMNVKSHGTDTPTVPPDMLYEFGKQAITRYRTEREKNFFRQFDKGFNNIKYSNKTRETQEKAISSDQTMLNTLNQIYAEFPYAKDCFSYLHNNSTFSHVVFIEFFAGKWVEDLVLQTLLKLHNNPKNPLPVSDIKKGVEAEFDRRPCEVDVIAIRGYQLFLCSCTTSQDIKYVKQKAFEALYRAEELGGEHAKVIVISLMYYNLKELEKDLQQFDAKRNCLLIGLEELEDELKKGPKQEGKLSEKLRTMITK